MKSITIQNQRFNECLKALKKRKQDEEKSPSNITSVYNHAKEFLSFIENKEVYLMEKITQADIDDYFVYLSTRKNQRRSGGLSSSYLNKHREAVLRLMEFFYDKDVGQTPFTIRIFSDVTVLKDILTEEEVLSLFELCESTFDGIRNKAILSVLYGCGFRKEELFRLNVSDINMLNETIRVKKAKNHRQRDVPMSTSVKQNIEDYLFNVRNYLERPTVQTDAFLLTNSGVRMSKESIHFKVKRMAKASSITKPISCHLLRHAIGTHLVDHFTIEEIALFLGHRSIDSTQIYLHYKHSLTH